MKASTLFSGYRKAEEDRDFLWDCLSEPGEGVELEQEDVDRIIEQMERRIRQSVTFKVALEEKLDELEAKAAADDTHCEKAGRRERITITGLVEQCFFCKKWFDPKEFTKHECNRTEREEHGSECECNECFLLWVRGEK